MNIASSQVIVLSICLVLAVISLLVAYVASSRKAKMQKERDAALTSASNLKEKYSPIIDAEMHAKSILEEANFSKVKADEFLARVKSERESIIAYANEEAKKRLASAAEELAQLATEVSQAEERHNGYKAAAFASALAVLSSTASALEVLDYADPLTYVFHTSNGEYHENYDMVDSSFKSESAE